MKPRPNPILSHNDNITFIIYKYIRIYIYIPLSTGAQSISIIEKYVDGDLPVSCNMTNIQEYFNKLHVVISEINQHIVRWRRLQLTFLSIEHIGEMFARKISKLEKSRSMVKVSMVFVVVRGMKRVLEVAGVSVTKSIYAEILEFSKRVVGIAFPSHNVNMSW